MKLFDIFESIKESTKDSRTDHFLTKNIQDDTIENDNFRKILFTSKDLQLVLMSLKPGEDIGTEVHENIDQFFRVESGSGIVIFNDNEFEIVKESAFIVPQGTKHNIKNTSETEELKLYTLYAPPRHNKNTVHKTKKDAMSDKEYFNGETNLT